MRLISVKDYIDLHFTGEGKPSERTVRYWAQTGILPGKKIGRKWWIDLSLQKTGNALIDRVLYDT